MVAGDERTTTLPLVRISGRVDEALERFLARRRDDLIAVDPASCLLVDELLRMVSAGGKRIRPAFCYWGHLAAGGDDGSPIVSAAAALELFHTFALIHDDVMDHSATRRGEPASHVRLAGKARDLGLACDPVRFGVSAAILAGDLAAVLADEMFLESGFPPGLLEPALLRYHRMRSEMAVGQLLDLEGAGSEASEAARVADLKTGGYTVEGPLHIGAILAGGSQEALACLSLFGAPLGRAFQLRDDLQDREEDGRPFGPSPGQVDELVDLAVSALDPRVLAHDAVGALSALAELVRP